MKYKEIKINDKLYRIEKMPLGRYGEVMGALDKLPKHIDTFSSVSEEEIIASLPKIAKDAMPELIKILSLASGISEKILNEEMGLDDAALIIKTIWEVNNYDQLGKALGRFGVQLTGHFATRISTKVQKNGSQKQ